LLLVHPSWNNPLRAITIITILLNRHRTSIRTSLNPIRTSINPIRTQPVQPLRLSTLELR
jgi:hypothetical protein